MMDKEKKFKSSVQFESSDQGGTFDPIKVPDLKPYLEQNRAVEQRDLETHMNLGLKDLKLEQDRMNGALAYNKVVQSYLADETVRQGQTISKSLAQVGQALPGIIDHFDQKNALTAFNNALMRNEIPALEAVLEYENIDAIGQQRTEALEAIAGEHLRNRDLDMDNIERLLSLSDWRDGPYRMKLLLRHYAKQVPDYLNHQGEASLTLDEFPDQEFTLQNVDSWPKGHKVQIRAALEQKNIDNLIGLFAGFPEEAVGRTVTPAIIDWRQKNDINFADQLTNEKEKEIMNNASEMWMSVKESTDPLDFGRGVQEAINYLTTWTGNRGLAKDTILDQLAKDAQAGLLPEAKASEFLDSPMTPVGQKRETTWRKFLGERKVAELDLEGKAATAAFNKQKSREKGHDALKLQAQSDIKDAVQKYKEQNNGSFPPKEVIQELIKKYEDQTGLDGADLASGILTAENANDKYVIETFDYLRIQQGGKLTADQLANASYGVRKHFMDKNQVTESTLVPNKARVKSSESIIDGMVNDHIPSLGLWDEGEIKREVQASAKLKYREIYQSNLDGQMPHHLADKDARAQVRDMIKNNEFSIAEHANKKGNAKFLQIGQELKGNMTNGAIDTTIPLESIKKDVAKVIAASEAGRPWPHQHSIAQAAALAQVPYWKMLVDQSGGKIKIPSIESKMIKATGGMNTIITAPNGSNQTYTRGVIENPGVSRLGFNPVYLDGQYDARDNRNVLVKVNVESLTIADALGMLETGQLSNITGYKFNAAHLADVLNRSNEFDLDTVLTPDVQEILYLYLKNPNATERDQNGYFRRPI